MTAAKPWYDKSNEKEPGNPLSRVDEYNLRDYGASEWAMAHYYETRLRELLAVIDGMEAERKGFAIALEDANAVICRREKEKFATQSQN